MTPVDYDKLCKGNPIWDQLPKSKQRDAFRTTVHKLKWNSKNVK
jgi:hypothetical protein